MIVDISDEKFKNILNDEQLFLPIRWDGVDFPTTLNELFNYYIHKIRFTPNYSSYSVNNIRVNVSNIQKLCNSLNKVVIHYLNGFPSIAYKFFEEVMNLLIENPLKIYQKSIEQFETFGKADALKLFRVVGVEDNRPYQRTRLFHTPYNLRSKVSTSRYSIAGYPSLYLGTSLALCCEEIHRNPYQNFTLASMFKLNRMIHRTNTNIKVIELGIKPQDFINVEYNNESREYNNESRERRISNSLLENKDIKSAYLLWYPLIASCSYIRTNKNDPFAPEYIIPQLLMQWVRNEIKTDNGFDQLVGIRYFSCASVRASEMGFNYVFPTSGLQKCHKFPYCPILAKSFFLTNPVYIHEYDDIRSCENNLKRANDFKSIDC